MKAKRASKSACQRLLSDTPTTLAKPSDVFQNVRELIIAARQDVARAVNSALVMLYWRIGQRIREEILRQKRAEHGKEILQTLSAKLAAECGRGFSNKSLRHMVRFAEAFPDEEIVSSLRRQLRQS